MQTRRRCSRECDVVQSASSATCCLCRSCSTHPPPAAGTSLSVGSPRAAVPGHSSIRAPPATARGARRPPTSPHRPSLGPLAGVLKSAQQVFTLFLAVAVISLGWHLPFNANNRERHRGKNLPEARSLRPAPPTCWRARPAPGARPRPPPPPGPRHLAGRCARWYRLPLRGRPAAQPTASLAFSYFP